MKIEEKNFHNNILVVVVNDVDHGASKRTAAICAASEKMF